MRDWKISLVSACLALFAVGCGDNENENCGNGALNGAEQCDDGNNTGGDGCDAACFVEGGFVCEGAPSVCEIACGNGALNTGEACDDANAAPGDGCDNLCQIEDGFECSGEPSVCAPINLCGNNTLDAGEACDDGNNTDADGCQADCTLSTVAQLAVGGFHNCALIDGGALRCFGSGFAGELGYGNENNIGDNETPAVAGSVDVGGVVLQVAAGETQTCAVLDTGALRCWGFGNNGRLGYGNEDNLGDNETPATAGDIDLGGTATQAATGAFHSCALLSTGNVRCFGNGSLGRLGYASENDLGDNETPATAGDIEIGGAVVQLAAGGDHSCVVLDNGAVRCWGSGIEGQLGYGNFDNIGDDETPAFAGDVNLGGLATQVVTGSLHTCALLDNGAVRCWGNNLSGQLGYGNTTPVGGGNTPAQVGDVPLGATATQLAAGRFHTCALLSTGNVRCWGNNFEGQLGYGNTLFIGDDETPDTAGDVDLGGATVVQIGAGASHTCALLDTGAVRCWGAAAFGRLGTGNEINIGDDETPAGLGDIVFF